MLGKYRCRRVFHQAKTSHLLPTFSLPYFLCNPAAKASDTFIMRTSTYFASLAFAAASVLARPGTTASAPSTAGTASPELDGYDRPDTEEYNRYGKHGGPSERNKTYSGNWHQPQQGQGQGQGKCMSREDAINVAGTFQSLIQGYTQEQALAALTPDFVDHTSAVSIIINRGGSGPEDVTEPVFTSRDEFMQGHGTQEPIPFETLQVWSTCDGTVTMVWQTIRSGQGQENEVAAIPVVGVAVLETEPTSRSTGIEYERAVAGGYHYRIHTLWSEFNTAAWLVNNGAITLDPEVPTIPPPEEEVTESPESTIVKKRGLATSKFDVGLA